MDIKAIIFDKDGTLIDFAQTFDAATGLVLDELCEGNKELMVKAADALGYDLQKKVNLPHSLVIASHSHGMAEALAGVLPIGNIDEFAAGLDRMFGEICLNTVMPIDGIPKALDDLHAQGMILGVATNDSEENANEQMEEIELDHLFENILGADSGYGPKPGTGMLDAFVIAHGLQPYQVMMVGDSVQDLEAGVAAGMVTVGVESGPANRAELEEHADFIIASVVDLPALIAQN